MGDCDVQSCRGCGARMKKCQLVNGMCPQCVNNNK